ncbi:polymer-forming cytoskeletal protein [Clostridium polynesiense]|uniref:polymer-forming cytoskeletal protein n=1 Tax=Clostridium polynesiense TaxID=1325933 RepID=UPI00058DE6D7|nr:polymer-forming cytoskeletal protein [Clostridium polynesiense]
MESTNYEERGDLKISGSGSAGGGKYNLIKISGSGTVKGDVHCRELSISGSGKIDGDIEALYIKLSGSGKILGNVKGEEIKVSGSGHFGGDVEVQQVKISGSSKVEGKVSAEEISISGSFKAVKKIEGGIMYHRGALACESCEVENFDSDGSFNITTLLSADVIDIKLVGRCAAREIGGEIINIRKGTSRKGLMFSIFGSLFDQEGSLKSEVIEGDEIYLENTEAKIVRGSKVIIGPGCSIEGIEYKDTLEIDKSSIVKDSVKL